MTTKLECRRRVREDEEIGDYGRRHVRNIINTIYVSHSSDFGESFLLTEPRSVSIFRSLRTREDAEDGKQRASDQRLICDPPSPTSQRPAPLTHKGANNLRLF